MVLKIESKNLVEFISKATLNGRFSSTVLNFKSDGVHIQSKDEDNTVMQLAFMSFDAFESYDEITNPVGVKNTVMFINVLKSFTGLVNLQITNDTINIYNEKKSASIKTGNVQYLNDNNLTQVPEVFNKFDAGVNLSTDVFKDSVRNISIVNSEEVIIESKDKVLSIEVGENNFDKITEKVNCDYHNVMSYFNSTIFKSVVDILPDKSNVSLPKDGFPIQFSYKTDIINGRVLLGPNKVPTKPEEVKVTSDTKIDDLVDDKSDELL